jgi:hypothetical protein
VPAIAISREESNVSIVVGRFLANKPRTNGFEDYRRGRDGGSAEGRSGTDYRAADRAAVIAEALVGELKG